MKNVFFFKNLDRLNIALKELNILDFEGKKIPIKMHMGEKNNKYFSKPELVEKIIKDLRKFNINPFLFDTTVAYTGMRHTTSGYKKLAEINGFTHDIFKVKIDDKGIPVKVENHEYEVANTIYNSTHIFSLSHVKGHIATGMGGAIKNFGMGGVTKETKIKMHHGSRPIYNIENCDNCGICAEVCPFDSIEISNGCWIQNMESCFGCGVCVENCKKNALTYMDDNLQYLMACAAMACVQNKKVIYFNDVNNISRSCDCDPSSGPIICKDIGYLVSDDIVAVDKASLDLINKVNEDIFLKKNKIDPIKQIKFGEKIGLGSSKYKLIEL